MTRAQIIQRYAECMALCLHSDPLDDIEKARYRSAVAREEARAMERRRQQEPQLRLDEVA